MMNSTMIGMKGLVAEHKNVILAGVYLTLALSIYFIFWHWSIIIFGSIYSIRVMTGGFLRLAATYSAVSAVLSGIVCGLLVAVRGRGARKFIVGAALFLFFATEFIRMFDWGALYFGGNHVDTNFWAHAFYADGAVFLTTWVSLGIYAVVALMFAVLFVIIRNIYRCTEPRKAGAQS